jgi:hypothetical protein
MFFLFLSINDILFVMEEENKKLRTKLEWNEAVIKSVKVGGWDFIVYCYPEGRTKGDKPYTEITTDYYGEIVYKKRLDIEKIFIKGSNINIKGIISKGMKDAIEDTILGRNELPKGYIL